MGINVNDAGVLIVRAYKGNPFSKRSGATGAGASASDGSAAPGSNRTTAAAGSRGAAAS